MEVKKSKLILITGGRGGLGKALAEQLIKENATVIVTSRHATFQENMTLVPGDIHLQQLDVTQEHSVQRLFSWLNSLKNPLDVLVNNAGLGTFNSVENTSTDEWDLIIKTNLTGAFLCAREAYRIMKENGGGRIINIGSIANKVGLNNNLAYGASKWGLKGLSTNLSEEGNLTEAAANLFKMIRLLDRPPFQKISVAPIPLNGLGLALNDRLQRAAATREL